MDDQIPGSTGATDAPNVTTPWAAPPASPEEGTPRQEKQPVYLKWWFWLIVLMLLLIAVVTALGDDATSEKTYPPGDRAIVLLLP